MSRSIAAAETARSWSVRSRIVTAVLLLATLAMAVAGTVAYLAQRERLISEVDSRLISVIEQVRFVALGAPAAAEGGSGASAGSAPDAAEQVTASTEFDSTQALLRAVMQRLVPHQHEGMAALLEGSVRYLPGIQQDVELQGQSELLARVVAESEGGRFMLGTALSELGALRYVSIPVSVSGDPASGIIVVAVALEGQLESLNQTFLGYSAVATISVGLLAVASWLLAGRLLRPLRQLHETASRITLNDLGERIPVRGRDDVTALGTTMNAMLDRLQDAVTVQKHLLDDVRHELNTPLTIIRGHLELLDADSPAEVAEAREIALDELDRMQQLIAGIQLLSDAQDPMSLRLREVPVAEFTEQLHSKVRAMPDHVWELAETAQTRAVLDPDRITQAVLQLAENAAKYAPKGSMIALASRRTAAGVEFSVSDQGPGIPEHARQRIFERFGRVDTGRGVSGSGFGLAIVTAIVAAHGGRVLLESAPGEGSTFTIVLPERQSPPRPQPKPWADGREAQESQQRLQQEEERE